ncbi:MAG: hypothetical protein JWO91_3556 [Acidobacteriaceae bacterium]|nr:hypothetical protein [Acidobacteriaceae bacterium]
MTSVSCHYLAVFSADGGIHSKLSLTGDFAYPRTTGVIPIFAGAVSLQFRLNSIFESLQLHPIFANNRKGG